MHSYARSVPPKTEGHFCFFYKSYWEKLAVFFGRNAIGFFEGTIKILIIGKSDFRGNLLHGQAIQYQALPFCKAALLNKLIETCLQAVAANMADCTWTDKEMLRYAVERKFL